MLVFAATIGVGACLLFQVQFILGKQILPWFGGAPAVWTTCMLFFQVLLLAGYGYAHLLGRSPSPLRQRNIHLGMLLLALALLLVRVLLWPSPITPSDEWKPGPDDLPSLAILGLLLFTIGLPFLVLSSTGPLLQAWYARCFPGASPYRLYALSNLGSLLGLLSYPFLLEPALSVTDQRFVPPAGFDHERYLRGELFEPFVEDAPAAARPKSDATVPDASEHELLRLRVRGQLRHSRAGATARLRSWIRREGGDVVLEGPTQERDAFLHETRALLARYESEKDGHGQG